MMMVDLCCDEESWMKESASSGVFVVDTHSTIRFLVAIVKIAKSESNYCRKVGIVLGREAEVKG